MKYIKPYNKRETGIFLSIASLFCILKRPNLDSCGLSFSYIQIDGKRDGFAYRWFIHGMVYNGS